jgi:cytoskeleton protein RodZ
VLRATAPTWVQVRGPEGHVVYDHVMQAGDTWQVPPATPGLLMTTGNAGGLLVSDNGTDLGGFGRAGAVRHNIPLTEAGLKTALQPAAPPSSTPAISTPAATPDQPTLHLHPVHHVPTPSPPTDDSADQLNARQLRSH